MAAWPEEGGSRCSSDEKIVDDIHLHLTKRLQ